MSLSWDLKNMWMVADDTSIDSILDGAVHNLLREKMSESKVKETAIGELKELISHCSDVIKELRN